MDNSNTLLSLIKTRYLLYLIFFLVIAGCGCSTQKPFKFGVIADIQFADKDMRINRHYRTSILRLRESVEYFNESPPGFVIQVGDVIDGYADDQ